jgi:hypothetical protein
MIFDTMNSRYRIIPDHVEYDGFQESERIGSGELIRSELGEPDKWIIMRNPVTHRITVGSIRSDPIMRFQSDFVTVRSVSTRLVDLGVSVKFS